MLHIPDNILSPRGPVLPSQGSILSSRTSASQQRLFDHQQNRLRLALDRRSQDPVYRMRALELEVKKANLFRKEVTAFLDKAEAGRDPRWQGSLGPGSVRFSSLLQEVEDSGNETVPSGATSGSQTPGEVLPQNLEAPESLLPTPESSRGFEVPPGPQVTSTPLSSFRTAEPGTSFEDQGFNYFFLF